MNDVPQLAPEADQAASGNPHAGYLGNLVQDDPAKPYAQLFPLLCPLDEWCQNVLVQGGVGSGKTTSVFQNYGMSAAHLGHTVIAVDTKWPQRDSGLRELIGYWHAMGRDVVLFAPFEPNSVKLDVTGDLATFDAALRYSDTVMPPPEFRDEPGQHYKQLERRVLAALGQANSRTGGTQGDLLNRAMDPPREITDWIASLQDPMLNKIINSATSRGEKDFADSMTGIITALRVFFNEHVARATTPGQPHETIDLEACFRRPTLIYVALNQEDMLDGSGTILLRLFMRRVIEAIFRVARSTPTGKLPHPTTFAMDEQPSYGRLNYLMRISATMRSYNMAIMFGLQSSAQGKLVYGADYWAAISENVITRRIAFPRGLTGEDAKDISARLGMTTNLGLSINVSEGRNGEDDRYSAGSRLERQPLLAPEEFSTFKIGEAVIISSQHPPIRSIFTPIAYAEVKHPRVKPGTPNWLHEVFYKDMAARLPEGVSLSGYTDQLIARGTFHRLPPHLQMKGEELAPGLTRGAGAAAVQQQFSSWLGHCMAEQVDIALVHNGVRPEPIIQIGLDSLEEHRELAQGAPFYEAAGLLRRVDASRGLQLTREARGQLAPEVIDQLHEAADLTPVQRYLRTRGAFIEGHPARDAVPEAAREDPVGILRESQGLLLVQSTQLNVMWPKRRPSFPKERVGTKHYSVIPYRDAAALRAVVQGNEPALQPAPPSEAPLFPAAGS
ncbi:type IV secretory system conjugative DNA transfer family protein [Deinococcus multiflagellatus]|uniref:Type IV secretory system conjugative DNA transfer family protein n=3 Tax=Deinococcus multiflagellatus TaxID=1656887 RepID=A0ABW1ZTZ7_9DEIO